jgi:hypothetical protein
MHYRSYFARQVDILAIKAALRLIFIHHRRDKIRAPVEKEVWGRTKNVHHSPFLFL